MPGYEQIPYGSADPGEFIDNPSPRCQVVLVLDTSGSMSGKPIEELNAGLQVFAEELRADELAMKRAEIAIVTFGPVKVEQNFVTADRFYPPTLQSSGNTPMGEAVEKAIAMLAERKAVVRAAGVQLYRPWIFLMTDGGPTDDITRARQLVQSGVDAKSFLMFAVGVEGARMDILNQLSPGRPAMPLKGLSFRELFQWLSASLSQVSRSRTDQDKIPLPSPASWMTT